MHRPLEVRNRTTIGREFLAPFLAVMAAWPKIVDVKERECSCSHLISRVKPRIACVAGWSLHSISDVGDDDGGRGGDEKINGRMCHDGVCFGCRCFNVFNESFALVGGR